MRQSTICLLFAGALIAFCATHLVANVIPPIGLAPGSQYQLIFVTADPHDAINTDIGVYNSFVTSEAALGVASGLPVSATWNAVASTSAVDANANAPSGALPVYNTAGQEVTAAGVGIYTGVLDNFVAYDQYGNVGLPDQSVNVWTGSNFQGFGIAGATLGAPGDAEVGQLALDGTWLQFGTQPKVNEVPFSLQFYALSSTLTVPTPEPATLTLLGSALALLCGHRLLRWRKR